MVRVLDRPEVRDTSHTTQEAPVHRITVPEPELAKGRRPIRWMRWLAGLIVIAAGVVAGAYLLTRDDTTAVIDADGSFQVAETQRMTALSPYIVTDIDGSFQVAETQRMTALSPYIVTDIDGSFQAAETQRMTALSPYSVLPVGIWRVDLDGSFQVNETARMMALQPIQ